IRPKSIATVVVVFDEPRASTSSRAPSFVIVSSVVSGLISLTEVTSVVLPTPSGPTTAIFSAVASAGCSAGAGSEPLKATEHLLEQFGVGQHLGPRRAGDHQARRDQVVDEDR